MYYVISCLIVRPAGFKGTYSSTKIIYNSVFFESVDNNVDAGAIRWTVFEKLNFLYKFDARISRYYGSSNFNLPSNVFCKMLKRNALF